LWQVSDDRVHPWRARRRHTATLVDRAPGGHPVHGVLAGEVDASLAVAERWAPIDRSHRKLAHRGSYEGLVWVAPSTVHFQHDPRGNVRLTSPESIAAFVGHAGADDAGSAADSVDLEVVEPAAPVEPCERGCEVGGVCWVVRIEREGQVGSAVLDAVSERVEDVSIVADGGVLSVVGFSRRFGERLGCVPAVDLASVVSPGLFDGAAGWPYQGPADRGGCRVVATGPPTRPASAVVDAQHPSWLVVRPCRDEVGFVHGTPETSTKTDAYRCRDRRRAGPRCGVIGRSRVEAAPGVFVAALTGRQW
jgi:hypothetical protein